MTFNLSKIHRLGGEKPPSLSFRCTVCDRLLHRQAHTCLCGNNMFKVARSMPLMNYPLEPYRNNRSTEEDGYSLTTPGDNNTGVGGSEITDFPQDGAEGEEVGTPNAKSDDLTQDSPMKDSNRPKNDYGVGVHTMNSVMPTSSPDPSIFNRTKSKLQYNFTQGR